MGRNVFIREEPSAEKPLSCGHSISTFFNPCDEYLFDYFNFEYFKDTYDYVFSELTQRLKKEILSKELSYRGVELLSCFKLNLFTYASSAAIAASAITNFLESNTGDTAFISEEACDWVNPYLHQILQGCLPNITDRVHIVKTTIRTLGTKANKKRDVYKIGTILKKYIWPKEISLSYGKQPVIFFSDYQRIKHFVPSLHRSAIFFSNSKAPKIFVQSLREKISYEQTAGLWGKKEKYAKVALNLIHKIHGLKIFGGMKTAGYDFEAILEQKADELFRTNVPDLLYQIDRIHNMFDRKRSVKTALLDEDITPSKNAFCQVARGHSISSYVECHGALAGAYGYVPVTADRIFVWGKEQKDKLMRWGCPSEKVIISGCSRYDQYKQMKNEKARKEVLSRLNFDEFVRTVMFVPHALCSKRNFLEKVVFNRNKAILDTILGYPNIQLIIKLHPSYGSPDYYEERCSQADVRCKVKILKNFDPFLLIKSSDFMIVHDSTMALDGFAMGRNIIFFPAIGTKSHVLNSSISDFEKYNIFHCPSDMTQFKEVFERLLKDSQFRPNGAKWEEARRQCLNEGSALPAEIIASYLLNYKLGYKN